MSFMFAQPQMLMDAATDLAGIGTTLNAANTAAALPTTSVLAAGADEVSATMAAMFGAHAQQYQAMSAQAANLHTQFVQAMNTAATKYAGAEAANASPLQVADRAGLDAVNSQAPGLLARPAGGVGSGPRSAQLGRPVRSATGTVGGARAGSSGRVGTGAPVGRSSAFGAGGAARNKTSVPVATNRSVRVSKGFGAGGPGGAGLARDLRASYDKGQDPTFGRPFGGGRIGAAGVGMASGGRLLAR